MNIAPKATVKLFIVTTPVIALLSSVSPCFAGTLAKAETETLIYDFSQVPTSISTFTDAQTLALAVRGTVLGEAEANANFDVDLCWESDNCSTLVNNSSQAKAEGEGQEYLGLAQSQAAAIGYQFEIAENQNFSFNIFSLLNLDVTKNSLQKESAEATNYIAFYLFDDSTDNLLDFFTLNSSLTSSKKHDLSIQNSQGFQLSPLTTKNTQENQAFVEILLSGLYSRQFSEHQNLTLIAYQTSSTMVKAPEPSTSVGLLIVGVLGTALGWKKKSTLSD